MGQRVGRRVVGRTLAAALALQFVLFATTSAVLFMWPRLPELPARVDAIIELGGPGDRDSGALPLARAHRAAYLVQSTVEGDLERCLPPMPDVTILCFHAVPETTRGEAESIGRLAAQYHWTSIILVTTPDQAQRARLRVSRCFGGQVYSSTTPLPTLLWFKWLPYQWAATVKALAFEREC